ncbi:monocarboxylate transporter 12-like isoform X2 [Acanthaster planci]|nr:monocarboxylate transporter 12-like isoform X2 [Acanthaster planci]
MARSPDGGWSIIIVIATSVCLFLTVGMTRCVGVLYSSWKSEFETSAAMTGALASIVLACAHFISPIGAIVCRGLGCRVTMILGGTLTATSLLISSWAQNIYQMYVLLAVAGFGIGLGFVAGLVVVAIYFKKYYKAANGVASSGIGIGLVAFPPLLQLLLDSYGWRGTLVIMAGITCNICVGGALFRPLHSSKNNNEQSERSGNEAIAMQQQNQTENEDEVTICQPHVQRRHRCACALLSPVAKSLGLHLLRNWSFTFFCWINILATMPYICYLVFIFPRASAVGISDQASSLVVSVLGITSIFGRLISGVLINWKFSSVKVFAAALLFCSGATLLTQLEIVWSFVASSCLMGFFTGVTQATTSVVVRQCVGNDNIGTGIGMCFFFNGIADLVGPIMTGPCPRCLSTCRLILTNILALDVNTNAK